MNETPLWASESFWKKTAIWVTAGSFLILVVLTMDSLSKTSAGSKRVPAYAVINKKIDYQYNKELHKYMPDILFRYMKHLMLLYKHHLQLE